MKKMICTIFFAGFEAAPSILAEKEAYTGTADGQRNSQRQEDDADGRKADGGDLEPGCGIRQLRTIGFTTKVCLKPILCFSEVRRKECLCQRG